jgi:hypothetical protein
LSRAAFHPFKLDLLLGLLASVLMEIDLVTRNNTALKRALEKNSNFKTKRVSSLKIFRRVTYDLITYEVQQINSESVQ